MRYIFQAAAAIIFISSLIPSLVVARHRGFGPNPQDESPVYWVYLIKKEAQLNRPPLWKLEKAIKAISEKWDKKNGDTVLWKGDYGSSGIWWYCFPATQTDADRVFKGWGSVV
ncbi:hypothetical protein TWF696_008017 [Orbilia brochopaga]|uniref:Uncharacterized protein n=1 Tax=Orbilia brochopaga TaxID=3140254 RepID=A0AAV9UQB6_9PEZI